MTTSFLANSKTTKETLQEFGLTAKHALGQNFLISDNIIKKILAFADLHPHDVVLEVGPGIGTLTVALLPRVKNVIAIEKDAALLHALQENAVAALQKTHTTVYRENLTAVPPINAESAFQDAGSFPGRKAVSRNASGVLKVLEADALSVDLSCVGELAGVFGNEPTKFVSNLPYEIAATIVLDAFQKMPALERTVVMVQKEVANRMCAKPSSKIYGAYTAKLALWATVADSFLVGRNNFLPVPHVDSAVVLIKKGAPSPFIQRLDDTQKKEVAAFIDVAFSQRRKQMLKVLAANGYKRERLEKIFSELEIDLKVRAEALAPPEFAHVVSCYKGWRP